MRVNVAQKFITNGSQKNSQHCMIADAIRAARPNAKYVMVDTQSIRFSDPKERLRYVYLTPPIAQLNILRYDQGKKVTPFSFNLNAPMRVKQVLNWTERRRRRTASQKLRRKKSDKQNAAWKAKYAHLAANRALNHQKEREFGLRKLTA